MIVQFRRSHIEHMYDGLQWQIQDGELGHNLQCLFKRIRGYVGM